MIEQPGPSTRATAAPRALRTWATATLIALASPAYAADPPARLDFKAGRVEADPALGDVTLERGVELGVGRYRVRSERLRIHRDGSAVVFEGDARLALCPCPAPPLVFAASGGRFEPPGDVVLRRPRVELGGVPVFGLPWLWLRTPDRIGLLPPIIALRGTDGLLLGGGVHLPWHGAEASLDLTAGGFTAGGVEAGASLATPTSRTRVVFDWVHGERVAIESRGSLAFDHSWAALAWNVDALLGARALTATIDLAPAARPFDTGAMEASLRLPAGPVVVLAGAGLVARAERGSAPSAVADGGAPVGRPVAFPPQAPGTRPNLSPPHTPPIEAGPRVSLGLGGGIGRAGSWSVDTSAVLLGDSASIESLPIVRADAAAEVDARPGPFELRASAGARAWYAGPLAPGEGPSRETAAAARAELTLPFARTFSGSAPITHWITPVLSVRGAVADLAGDLFAPIAGRVPGSAWMAATGLSTAIGRYAGASLRLDARAGAAFGRGWGGSGSSPRSVPFASSGNAAQPLAPPYPPDPTGPPMSLLHARLGADARVAALALEAAAVGPSVRGQALLARSRFGAEDGPFLRVDAAVQGGAGAGQARAVAAGAWAWLPGDALAYLSATGITFGAEVSVPWARVLRTTLRTDLDLTAGQLLSLRGTAEYRHPCGCLGVGLVAGHRLGRDGVDAALTIDVAPRRSGERARR